MILRPLKKEELKQFIIDVQESFQNGYEDYFGKCEDIIIPKKDIMQSYNAKGSHTFIAEDNGKVVGGAIISINEESQINELHILYVKVGVQSKGIGYFIWTAIEKLFPNTKIWKTCTPYFDKRNINFYVNKCKFHIVEFFNKYHKDPNSKDDFIGDAGEGMFEFEKYMINNKNHLL